MSIKEMDIDAVAKAIEVDAGEAFPDLRQALKEAKAGMTGRVTTPEQILVRQAREKSGLTQAMFAERIDTPVATLSVAAPCDHAGGSPAASHFLCFAKESNQRMASAGQLPFGFASKYALKREMKKLACGSDNFHFLSVLPRILTPASKRNSSDATTRCFYAKT
jgi:DNA-binding transcriptional regulator YiaG